MSKMLEKMGVVDLVQQGEMMEIVEEPDPRLHKPSAPIDKFGPEDQQLMANMLKFLVTNQGLGLAAVQVGVMKQILVVDAAACCAYEDAKEYMHPEPYLCMANAEVLELSQEKCSHEEYCFSYPGLGVEISRSKWGRFRYIDQNGEIQEIKAYGMLARCILHEMDHTHGKVIADYLSPVRKQMALKKFAKRSKNMQAK
ncbi:MAG: peptide deformylase [Proteobacteria bacterium]|nr:peptide deformylase [Pseudomonadota bacterium]